MAIDEPFEYLTFGGTFSRTFGILIDRFDVFMGLSAVVLVPYSILMITLSIFVAYVVIEEEEIPDFQPTHIPLVMMILTIQLVAYSLVTIIGRGAMIRVVGLMYIGQSPSWMSCLKVAWEKKYALIGANVIIYGALLLGFLVPWICTLLAVGHPNFVLIFFACVTGVAFIFGGLYAYIGAIMTNPAIMVENISNPLQGLQRSWDLATGSRCYLLCTLFCLWFLNNMVSRLLHNMFVTGDVMDIMFSIAGIVVSVIPMLIFFPLHAIMETVMYLNLRIGRESMNHQVLSGDLMSETPAGARFRNDDAGDAGHAQSMDYRHIPLMDDEDTMAPLAIQQVV